MSEPTQVVGEIAVRIRALSPGDSLARAAEAVRTSPYGAVPVVESGCLTGLVTSRSLADYVTLYIPRTPDSLNESGRDKRVADLPATSVIALPDRLPLQEALLFMQTNRLEVAPVLDHEGAFLGLVSTSELVGTLCGRGRLPVIGGMATPFGVYLTGGGARGGVGDFALFTAGVYLSVLQITAFIGADWLVRETPRWVAWLPKVAALLRSIHIDPMMVVFGALFCLLFRLSWITGYHAAEHQVVHALEAGDDLDPEVVARKPRVHPRCGTNLTVAMLIVSAFWYGDELRNGLNSFGYGFGALFAMIFILFSWRRLGAVVQQYVTTRPATLNQLRSGIKAAEELILDYRQNPHRRPNRFRRIWNMGILQVLGGAMSVIGFLAVLQWFRLLPSWIIVY